METPTQNTPAGVTPDGAQRRSGLGEHRANHAARPSAQVLYTFDGVAPNELSVRAGETVEILEQRDRGWWLAKRGGSEGWVPSSYVRLLAATAEASREDRA